MGSLNEIRTRINSIKSTRQITSAMRLVASSKHHKAVVAIDRFSNYQDSLQKMLFDFTSYCQKESVKVDVPFSSAKENVGKVAVVVVSSNMSLCGSFNENVVKKFSETMEEYKSLGWDNVLVIPIGVHVTKKVSSYPCVYGENLDHIVKNPTYDDCYKLSEKLIKMYQDGELDKIELIYNHCKSTSSQIVVRETFLPLDINSLYEKFEKLAKEEQQEQRKYVAHYVFEPTPNQLMNSLVSKLVRLKIYTVLLDSVAAEHSARMIAMQIATDNADDLLSQLKIQYNKQRQQAITNELLDIVGGSVNR